MKGFAQICANPRPLCYWEEYERGEIQDHFCGTFIPLPADASTAAGSSFEFFARLVPPPSDYQANACMFGRAKHGMMEVPLFYHLKMVEQRKTRDGRVERRAIFDAVIERDMNGDAMTFSAYQPADALTIVNGTVQTIQRQQDGPILKEIKFETSVFKAGDAAKQHRRSFGMMNVNIDEDDGVVCLGPMSISGINLEDSFETLSLNR